MNDTLGYRIADTCPKCSQHSVFESIVTDDGVQMDLCARCGIFWERETRENPYAERCDNCAFRPGSPEQSDPSRWREIIAATVKSGGTFYCHKRVPAVITDHGIEFEHTVEGGRCTNATECAGWLDAKIKQAEKRA